MSPALPGRFFTTSATCEAHSNLSKFTWLETSRVRLLMWFFSDANLYSELVAANYSRAVTWWLHVFVPFVFAAASSVLRTMLGAEETLHVFAERSNKGLNGPPAAHPDQDRVRASYASLLATLFPGSLHNCLFLSPPRKIPNKLKWKLRSILWDPMDCSPPASLSVHGILLSRILEWVAMSSSRGSSRSRDRTQVSSIAGRFFTFWVRKACTY